MKRSAKKNPDAESREDVASAGSLVVRDTCARTYFQKLITDRCGPSLQIDRVAAESQIAALDRYMLDRTVLIQH